MSAGPNKTGNCDGCGKQMQKTHRKHNGQHFCQSCYGRIFKPLPCKKCGVSARLPIDGGGVCKECERARPCVRCSESGKPIGKITKYGPVCNSCYPYFVEPKLCGRCGKVSRRLSRVSRLGIDAQVCQSCSRHDYATCQLCRRHRLLVNHHGRMLCELCKTSEATVCSTCGFQVPAGRKTRCENCYWQASHRKRVTIGQAAFFSHYHQTKFHEFAEWLLEDTGGHRAALSINRYLPFFLELEKNWAAVPSYVSLLSHFGAEGLRRVRLPMRWLTQTQGVLVDDEIRELDSERRRINSTLASLPFGSVGREVLQNYHDRLQIRYVAGKLSMRSLRLALLPAANLILQASKEGDLLPRQGDLNAFLGNSPGQRAALSGFIGLLRERYEIFLVVQDHEKTNRQRRQQLESAVLGFLSKADHENHPLKKWMVVALPYFHGVSKAMALKADEHAAIVEMDGYSVSINGLDYWIPDWTSFGNH